MNRSIGITRGRIYKIKNIFLNIFTNSDFICNTKLGNIVIFSDRPIPKSEDRGSSVRYPICIWYRNIVNYCLSWLKELEALPSFYGKLKVRYKMYQTITMQVINDNNRGRYDFSILSPQLQFWYILESLLKSM